MLWSVEYGRMILLPRRLFWVILSISSCRWAQNGPVRLQIGIYDVKRRFTGQTVVDDTSDELMEEDKMWGVKREEKSVFRVLEQRLITTWAIFFPLNKSLTLFSVSL